MVTSTAEYTGGAPYGRACRRARRPAAARARRVRRAERLLRPVAPHQGKEKIPI